MIIQLKNLPRLFRRGLCDLVVFIHSGCFQMPLFPGYATQEEKPSTSKEIKVITCVVRFLKFVFFRGKTTQTTNLMLGMIPSK